MDTFFDNLGIIGILILLGTLVLTVMMIIAILAIPKIARYQKAQTKILALIAKEKGISGETVETILLQEKMLFEEDKDFLKQLQS